MGMKKEDPPGQQQGRTVTPDQSWALEQDS